MPLTNDPLTCRQCEADYATDGDLCFDCARCNAMQEGEAAETQCTIWEPDADFHLLPDADLDSALRGLTAQFGIDLF